MKKTIIGISAMFFLVACGILSQAGANGFADSGYLLKKNTATPGQELKVELEDGAAIKIPSNSIDEQFEVKVERNPAKADNFPPLEKGFIQISDFYNFEVVNGNLSGPVELTFPINEDLIPDEKGVLLMTVPTDKGWEYIPVEANDGKVTIFTDQIGDPLITWHFVSKPKEPLCDPNVEVQGTQNGNQIDITGRVLPVRRSTNPFASLEELTAGIPLWITLNKKYVGEVGQVFVTETKDDGSFNFSIEAPQGLKDGWNWVFVEANCNRPWWGDYVVLSRGYAEFKYISSSSTNNNCSLLNLTPEECINEGQHTYSYVATLTDSDGKTTCETNNGTTDISFVIDGNGSITIGFDNGYVRQSNRININTYSGNWLSSEGVPTTWVATLTFTDYGFKEELSAINPDDNRIKCKWFTDYILQR